MSDIREAFDALKKLYVAQERPDRADLYNTVKAALSANGGEAAKSAPHSDYGYIPSKDHQWFFYDPEGDGMTFCKTEEEAFSGADQAILQSLDECWSECVDQICYGKIVQAAAQVDRVDRPENVGADGYTPDGVHWPQDCEFMCNYRLESVTHPAPPSVAVPDGLKSKVLELCSAVENDEDLPPVKYALKCGRLISEVKDILTAAPSPDHSGDAGKVVSGNEVKARVVSGARDMLRESGKQFRAIGDIGHAAMCENHADELDRLRTTDDKAEGV